MESKKAKRKKNLKVAQEQKRLHAARQRTLARSSLWTRTERMLKKEAWRESRLSEVPADLETLTSIQNLKKSLRQEERRSKGGSEEADRIKKSLFK